MRKDVVAYLKYIVSDPFTGKSLPQEPPPTTTTSLSLYIILMDGSVTTKEFPWYGRIDIFVKVLRRPGREIEDSQGTPRIDVCDN